MRPPVAQPVLAVGGADDPAVPVAALHGSAAHVAGAMCERVLAGVGHFPHEERPEEFTRLLLDWLGGL